MSSASTTASPAWVQNGSGPVPEVPRVDLDYELETPENAVLTFQLAGPAARLSAYFIDLMVMCAVWFVGSCIVGMYAASLGMAGVGVGIALLLWFAMEWFYFFFQEYFFRGKTLGKHLFRLRVVMDGGYPLTLLGAMLRNFLRAADAMPLLILVPLYGVGFFSAALSGQFRRLGDLVGRTIVIVESRVQLPQEPIVLEKITPLNRSEIGGFVPTPKTLALIEQFLGRRYALTYRRGHDMAAILANALARRLNYRGDPHYLERYPMAFLASVYATFHRSHDDDDEIRNVVTSGIAQEKRKP